MNAKQPEASPTGERQYLVISLGEEWYGVDLRQVGGVVSAGEITPVPGAPEHIVGVQDLRGRLLAILDTAGLLGVPSVPNPEHVIVLHHQDIECGCLITRAEDILALRQDQLEGPLPPLDKKGNVVCAQARVGDHLVGIIDAEALIHGVVNA